ncbi:hypothetical protein L3Q82_000893 [Scortum barcoo]|uniref:Uncharacterized protein n=1 Tax=Scortum barcoo TaxID=214431 RepID=A0ACB8WAM1_9TELE|nr:hypothetical protein L3Q82_000893 [Scortum barcoo]
MKKTKRRKNKKNSEEEEETRLLLDEDLPVFLGFVLTSRLTLLFDPTVSNVTLLSDSPAGFAAQCGGQQRIMGKFDTNMVTYVVPTCFKETIIVPKKPKILCLNDDRPVALTSTTMKCFERISQIIHHLFHPGLTGPTSVCLQAQ